MKQTISQRLKDIIYSSDMNIAEFATRSQSSAQNFHNKLRRNNWTVRELELSAKTLGADIHIDFTFPDGQKYKIL